MFKQNSFLKGVTLLELLIALIILGIVVGAAVAYQLNASRFFINPSIIRTQIQNNASIALAHMSQQIRRARYVSFSPAQATITLSPGTSNSITLNTTTYSISTANELQFAGGTIAQGINSIKFTGRPPQVDTGQFKAVEITLVAEDVRERIDDTITLVTSVYCREVVNLDPTRFSVSPNSGGGGDIVTVSGQNLMHDPPERPIEVYFGRKTATLISFTPGSPDKLVVRLKGHSKGDVDVVVINPDGGFVVLKDGFTYTKSTTATIVMRSDSDVVEKWFHDGGNWVAGDSVPYIDQQTSFVYTVSEDESGLNYIEEGEQDWYYVRIKGFYDDAQTKEHYYVLVSQDKETWQVGATISDPGQLGDGTATDEPYWANQTVTMGSTDPQGKGRFYFGAGTNYIYFVPAFESSWPTPVVNDGINFENGVIEVSKFKFKD